MGGVRARGARLSHAATSQRPHYLIGFVIIGAYLCIRLFGEGSQVQFFSKFFHLLLRLIKQLIFLLFDFLTSPVSEFCTLLV